MTKKAVDVSLRSAVQTLRKVRLELELLNHYVDLHNALCAVDDAFAEVTLAVAERTALAREEGRSDRELLEEEQRGRDAEVIDSLNRGER